VSFGLEFLHLAEMGRSVLRPYTISINPANM